MNSQIEHIGGKHGKGQHVGYIRVSSADQNTARQLDGMTLDRIFTEKVSGKNRQRPELEAMIAYVREGDTVFVHSMDRLARNLADLLALVKTITDKGVKLTFQKEGLTFSGDDSPMSLLMLALVGAVAEFERSIILERQREGIAVAKAAGAYKGAKKKLSPEQADLLRARVRQGVSKSLVAREFNISRQQVYVYLAEGSAE
ncbi:MAG: recombinase family protein [Proteobacteria bacterium]|nr:MAG: recombinase family protein [Pseudomonadota bacterium]